MLHQPSSSPAIRLRLPGYPRMPKLRDIRLRLAGGWASSEWQPATQNAVLQYFITLDLYLPDNGASCNDVFSRPRSRTRY